MSEAERLAIEVEDMPFKGWSTDINKRVAAELRRLSAELAALKAAMGEPVAWICEEQTIGPNYGKKRLTFSKYYSDNPLHYKHTPLYTHPAPQAKTQPLSETANVRGRWNIELDGDDLLVCFNDHDKGESCSYQRYVPAQQAKPQPLSDEQIDLLMRSIGTTYADDNDERMRNHAEWQRMNHRQIVRAIEAAHGITKE